MLGQKVSDYKIEPWTPVDSLAWLKAMAWDLKENYTEEAARAELAGSDPGAADRRALPAVRPAARTRRSCPTPTWPPRQRRRARRRRPTGRQPAAYLAAERAALRAATTALHAVPALVGQGDGIGSNSWVVVRRAHDDRKTVAGQRSSPRAVDPGHLVPDGSALPGAVAGLPVRRRGLHLRRAARRRHRPQRPDRLGLHQPAGRRHRPLPRAGRSATRTSGTASTSR